MKPVSPIPVLETARLCLRPFTLADEPAVFALASDPAVARFVRFEAHRTPADTRAFLEMAFGTPSFFVHFPGTYVPGFPLPRLWRSLS